MKINSLTFIKQVV